jgi:hypothetical protein
VREEQRFRLVLALLRLAQMRRALEQPLKLLGLLMLEEHRRPAP